MSKFKEYATECELVKESVLMNKINASFQGVFGGSYQIINKSMEELKVNYIEKVIYFIKENLVDTTIYENEDMKKHTTFKTGGTADLMVESNNISELQILMKYILKEKISYIIIGHGSNVIVSDNGIREVVVKIDKNLSEIIIENGTVEAKAGALFADVSKAALKDGLSGLEYACGIPGTIGGAVVMNAGAYGGEIKDNLVEALVLTCDGKITVRKVNELELGYRTSIIQTNGDVVLKAKFKLQKGDEEEIKKAMDDFTNRRKETQPLELPSAGSIFKRPSGHFVGKLIQDANLKGYQVGGAQVSTKHAGFIVNVDKASTSDILNLIGHIQSEINRLYQVELKTEVKAIGEF